MPGRKPCVQVAPPSVDVANPMSDEPPPETRPVWNAETIVLPNVNVSGSTSVLCCACVSVNGSELTWMTATFAAAGIEPMTTPTITAGGSSAALNNLRDMAGMAHHPSPAPRGRRRVNGAGARREPRGPGEPIIATGGGPRGRPDLLPLRGVEGAPVGAGGVVGV